MTAFAVNQTANSNADLLDKVHTFLTSNADLVAAGEHWESLEYTAGDYFIVRGKGLGGTDNIYIGWKVVNDAGADVYNIEVRGFAGYSPGLPFNSQPGVCPPAYLCSYDQPLTYWIVANGRRFIVVEKVSTVYLSAYCGLFYPYASPTEYPYPMYIGATTAISNVRWSSQVDTTHCACPMYENDGTGSGYYRDIGGTWHIFNNKSSSTSYGNIGADSYVYPFVNSASRLRTYLRDDYDGNHTIQEAVIVNKENETGPSGYVRLGGFMEGELDGIGHVSGFGLTAESTVNDGTDDWVAFHDVFQNAIGDYYAVRLK